MRHGNPQPPGSRPGRANRGLLRTRRDVVVAAVAVVGLAAAAGGLLVPHSLSVRAAAETKARAVAARTRGLDVDIAHGQWVAAHLAQAQADEQHLAALVPASADDQSLIAAVLAAATAAGAQLSTESRGEPAAGQQPAKVPVSLTANAPTPAAAIAFVASLQHQQRLIQVDGVTLTLAGAAQAHVSATAFADPSVPVPQAGG